MAGWHSVKIHSAYSNKWLCKWNASSLHEHSYNVHTVYVVTHCCHCGAVTMTVHYHLNVPIGVHQYLLSLPFLWFWLAIFLAASIEPAHFLCWSWEHLPECNSVPLQMKTSMFLQNSDINPKDCHLIVQNIHKGWQYLLNKFRKYIMQIQLTTTSAQPQQQKTHWWISVDRIRTMYSLHLMKATKLQPVVHLTANCWALNVVTRALFCSNANHRTFAKYFIF